MRASTDTVQRKPSSAHSSGSSPQKREFYFKNYRKIHKVQVQVVKLDLTGSEKPAASDLLHLFLSLWSQLSVSLSLCRGSSFLPTGKAQHGWAQPLSHMTFLFGSLQLID